MINIFFRVLILAVIVEQKFASKDDLSFVIKNLISDAREKFVKNGDLTVQYHTNTNTIPKKSKKFNIKKNGD